ncbi:MAG: hypothetical protein EYC69_05345 [Bacteroidetes bacterium]|nr:MAG: hypothetical protein EYC69_05345 [Bacteroidota bacterium]
MQKIISVLMLLLLSSPITYAGIWEFTRDSGSGTFSLGTRNALSLFNDIPGEKPGIGIGGQTRVQFSDRINTEWYLDYLTSTIGTLGIRNDYHIGWSMMYYFNKDKGFENFLKPYLIAGHCFDKTEVFERNKKSGGKSRLSMATQAGLGNHFNITSQLDFSISAQYMLHFGKELYAYEQEGKFIIKEASHSKPGGHLLTVFSINYKFAKLW